MVLQLRSPQLKQDLHNIVSALDNKEHLLFQTFVVAIFLCRYHNLFSDICK